MSKIQWFSGSIELALKQYQDIKGIILVYVYHKDGNFYFLHSIYFLEDNNEDTKLFTELWNQFDIEIFADVPVVPVKFNKDSADAIQFAQFCRLFFNIKINIFLDPTPMIPACYMIGLDGITLEVITTAESLDVSKFNEFLKKGVEVKKFI